jgi:hypothetical protein
VGISKEKYGSQRRNKMNLEEIKVMTPDQLSVELAYWANRTGLGDQRDVATIIELDESLLLQPIAYDPDATSGYPQCDSATGEFIYEDED